MITFNINGAAVYNDYYFLITLKLLVALAWWCSSIAHCWPNSMEFYYLYFIILMQYSKGGTFCKGCAYSNHCFLCGCCRRCWYFAAFFRSCCHCSGCCPVRDAAWTICTIFVIKTSFRKKLCSWHLVKVLVGFHFWHVLAINKQLTFQCRWAFGKGICGDTHKHHWKEQ